jgi:hypothetical protein
MTESNSCDENPLYESPSSDSVFSQPFLPDETYLTQTSSSKIYQTDTVYQDLRFFEPFFANF